MNAKEKLDVYFKLFEDMGSSKLISLLHRKDNSEIHRRVSEACSKVCCRS